MSQDLTSATFQGYRRENGRVGVRNHVIILPVDDLSNAACEAVANNIPNTMALPHPYGRLQFGELPAVIGGVDLVPEGVESAGVDAQVVQRDEDVGDALDQGSLLGRGGAAFAGDLDVDVRHVGSLLGLGFAKHGPGP